jgi:hypothetical protein
VKSLTLGLFLLLSAQAFATGSIYCSTPAKEYEFSGTTGRVAGNPLIGGMLVNTEEETQTFANGQVVGYWNMGDTLKFAVIDDNAEKLLYKVEASYVYSEDEPKFVGVLTLDSGEFFLVECEM